MVGCHTRLLETHSNWNHIFLYESDKEWQTNDLSLVNPSWFKCRRTKCERGGEQTVCSILVELQQRTKTNCQHLRLCQCIVHCSASVHTFWKYQTHTHTLHIHSMTTTIPSFIFINTGVIIVRRGDNTVSLLLFLHCSHYAMKSLFLFSVVVSTMIICSQCRNKKIFTRNFFLSSNWQYSSL